MQEKQTLRFVLAISALVLAGILLVLGIGQVTFLSGPQRVSFAEQFDAPNGLAVIEAKHFDVVAGQANVVLQGEGALISVGQDRDVQAWVQPFAHAEVKASEKDRSLVVAAVSEDRAAAKQYAQLVQAEPDKKLVPPSPHGSDLWLLESSLAPTAAEGEAAAENEAAEPTAPAVDADGAEEPASGAAAGSASAGSGLRTVRLPVSLEPDQSVLVSVADSTGAMQLSIEWVQDRRTPWAGPLLVGGGALALIGAILYLLAVDHDRRGLGPRRGRRGPLLGIRNVFASGRRGRSSRMLASALAVTAVVTLSGCSQNYWPDFSPNSDEAETAQESAAASNVAPVPVSAGQISRIVADVSEISKAADEALDATGLEVRFTGDALTERKANYTIRKAVSDYEVVVPSITDEELGYQLVQSTEGWPRTIFVVVAAKATAAETAEAAAPAEDEAAAPGDTPQQDAAAAPSLALIMSQQSPHENFLVSRTIALRGGITMPEAAPAEEGTALLADDLQTLQLAPADVGAAYAAVLADGTSSERAADFNLEGDSLVGRSGAAWVAQSAEAAAAGGSAINYSVSVGQSDAPIVSLSTGVGGGFVATTVLETRVEEPAEGSRWRPTVPKSLAALSGLEGQQEKLISVVAHQLLFYVPGKESGSKVQLLGYTSDLISASNS